MKNYAKDLNAMLMIYNTLSRKKEPFTPIDPTHIKFYACGPTVYDTAHIGNARPVVVFDVLFRLLKHLYPAVTYVRNITDVDDKIMVAAKERGIDIQTLTLDTTKMYQDDMAALHALPPSVQPKATEHILEMQAIIQTLIDKGHAYAAEGHVLFSVKSDPHYGQLSNLSQDDIVAGARVEVAPYKKDPSDFVLWKPSSPDQVGWDSPWGRGRPGWHIECSAMAKKYLGETFDIHGGGIDLVFPHHENEIAQSSCCHEKPLANYWMHNGHLGINGQKMSKSLGNFFTVREKLVEIPGEVIRLVLLSTHYRQPLDWTDTAVTQSKNILDRFYTALKDFDEPTGAHPSETLLDALKDDLNTPLAFSYLHTLTDNINKAETLPEKKKYQRLLKENALFLGFLNQSAKDWFQTGRNGTLTPEEIESLLQIRQQARKDKDFKTADTIRQTLESQGVLIDDTPDGSTWRYR
jgi:cysteinyl-tRNA synthetase